MFIILLSLLNRLSHPMLDDQLVSVMRPCIIQMHLDAMADRLATGCETEYFEYFRDGTLRPLFHEIDLIPEIISSYV